MSARTHAQDDDTFARKMAVRARLATAARAAIADCVDVYAVGSTVNGCGTSSSDMDLCAIVANTKADQSMKDTKM